MSCLDLKLMRSGEPAASFENPDDYMYTFSAEEGIAFKLAAAIYDAKVSLYMFQSEM